MMINLIIIIINMQLNQNLIVQNVRKKEENIKLINNFNKFIYKD
jgi:hypothetical protein